MNAPVKEAHPGGEEGESNTVMQLIVTSSCTLCIALPNNWLHDRRTNTNTRCFITSYQCFWTVSRCDLNVSREIRGLHTWGKQVLEAHHHTESFVCFWKELVEFDFRRSHRVHSVSIDFAIQ